MLRDLKKSLIRKTKNPPKYSGQYHTIKQLMKGQVKCLLVYKKSGELINKLKLRGFHATSLSTYDFSTLYTTLPHNLIKKNLKI